jgi:pyruvate/2-oxoglutarate dehydrogenase complex dihydrolipoamide acyltransferase (E2) component
MAKAAVTQRLAVLIDADNAPPQIAAALFAAVAKLGHASVRRIYGDFSGTRLKAWADSLAAHAIVPQQNFANIPGKNATDIALVIDAMDLLHSGRFDGFCLVSSDSDFTRLAARIREQGLDVYGFGEAHTPESFRQACKQFFPIEPMLPPKPPKPPKAEKPAKPAKPPPAPKAEPPPKPPAPPPKPAAAAPPPAVQPPGAAVDLLNRAVAQLVAEDGWADFNGVGTLIRAIAPNFAPKSYGCSKLSLLFTRTGQFEVRRGKHGQIFVRPLPFWSNPPDEVDELPDNPGDAFWSEQEELPF